MNDMNILKASAETAISPAETPLRRMGREMTTEEIQLAAAERAARMEERENALLRRHAGRVGTHDKLLSPASGMMDRVRALLGLEQRR